MEKTGMAKTVFDSKYSFATEKKIKNELLLYLKFKSA